MRLVRVEIENVRSFLDRQSLDINSNLSILIGPNGGGKTNLLDTIIWALRSQILRSWSRRFNPTQEQPLRQEFVLNDVFNNFRPERHFLGADRPQHIDLTLEVTQRDRENIEEMIRTSDITDAYWRDQPRVSPLKPNPKGWLSPLPKAGDQFHFRIKDGQLQPVVEAYSIVQEYLASYEIDASVREELGLSPLAFPMLSLPTRRAMSGFSSAVSLPSFNEFDLKRTVDAANSRGEGNLAAFATGRLAGKYRTLLSNRPATHEQEFYADPNVAALTEALREVGYDWRLIETNAHKNEYDVRLSKQGSQFMASSASSGEKELLTYLFAIYGLNVRDALIVIDEPELHLHPRWQVTLLNLFARLAGETGNQFLMATHSPAFVSPASVQYVSRVYSEKQQSKIVRLDSEELPERKHLFSIVNSFNNERIFFTDRVILVEGISDRIFFEALLEHFRPKKEFGQPYEVVSVGGKYFFAKYCNLLDACRIPWLLVADRDYAADIGPPEIEGLFRIDSSAVKSDVIENPKSMDGEHLVSALEAAIEGSDPTPLRELWTYIKTRRRKIVAPLRPDQEQALADFINTKRVEGILVLKRGALESYLPTGHGRKDLAPLIDLTSGPNFWALLPEAGKAELEDLAKHFLGLSSDR